MTTILTFWLCAFGTPCDAEHAAQINGHGSMATQVIDGDMTYCEEVDAWTNMRPWPTVLAKGLVTRHSCEPSGDDL
jgi:hypothetical protein